MALSEVRPSVIAEQKLIPGNPNGKGKEKSDSFQYRIAKVQNTLEPRVGAEVSEAELKAFIASHPEVRVNVQ